MAKITFKIKRKSDDEEVDKPISKKAVSDIEPRRDVHLSTDDQIRSLGASRASVPALDLTQPTDDSLEAELKTYIELSAVIKTKTAYKEKIKENLKAFINESGSTDANGNKYVNVLIAGVRFVMMVEKRSEMNLNREKAIKLCRARNYTKCIDVIEVLKDDAFEEVLKAGKIDDETVQDMTDETNVFAFKVYKYNPEADNAPDGE